MNRRTSDSRSCDRSSRKALSRGAVPLGALLILSINGMPVIVRSTAPPSGGDGKRLLHVPAHSFLDTFQRSSETAASIRRNSLVIQKHGLLALVGSCARNAPSSTAEFREALLRFRVDGRIGDQRDPGGGVSRQKTTPHIYFLSPIPLSGERRLQPLSLYARELVCHRLVGTRTMIFHLLCFLVCYKGRAYGQLKTRSVRLFLIICSELILNGSCGEEGSVFLPKSAARTRYFLWAEMR